MYGINFSGGANKTHGQVERADRIDSFEAGRVEGRGTLTARRDGSALTIPCERVTVGEREVVKLPVGGTLELARVKSGFGGSRAFWVCPRCGERARYLFFQRSKDEAWSMGFACRECCRLNYRVQQRTRSSINHVLDGTRLAREKLGWEPSAWAAPLDFPNLTPPCPPRMRQSTYQRHLARFRRYQEKYERDALREVLGILKKAAQR